MKYHENKKGSNKDSEYTRRDFIKLTKNVAIGSLVVGSIPGMACMNKTVLIIPASGGYLLVDTKKCQGCYSCMLACSLVHEGKENLSLARIQVIQDPFEGFPDDLTLEQCRQCTEPKCVEVCPSGALHVDTENKNIRRVDKDKCIGCMSCVEACPHLPSRAIWNHNKVHAQICDLCLDTPYWDEKGGPEGKQCCAEVCPVGAITFTTKIPEQTGSKGYKVNLRGPAWKILGYPTD